MSSLREIKLAQKVASQQRQLVTELESLARDIDRCEKMILDLQTELMAANAKYPSPRTTREDIAYLTELLKCANKKLVWEKLMGSLHKRAPALLEKMKKVMDDPENPPAEQTRAELARVLQEVQAALERLQIAKVE